MQVQGLIIIAATVISSIAAFFFLLRDCKKNIDGFKFTEKPFIIYSSFMIAVTIAISVVFATVYTDNSLFFSLKRVLLLSVMWPVAYTDVKSYRIPNVFIIYGLICRAVILVFELIFIGIEIWPFLLSELIASVALVVAALLCMFIIKNSIGFGDIKLFFVMGLMQGLDGIWGSVFLALIISFVIACVLLISKKKSRKDLIPFGPALVLGAFVSITLTGM